MCEGSGLNRRKFLEGCFIVTTAVSSGSYLWLNTRSGQHIAMAAEGDVARHLDAADVIADQHLDWVGDEAGLTLQDIQKNAEVSSELEQWLMEYAEEQIQLHQASQAESDATSQSTQAPSEPLEEAPDVVLSAVELALLTRTSKRIVAVREFVGFGNFNLISWDDLLAFARNIPSIGAFSADEIDLMESMFATDAATLGFLGERTGHQITEAIPRDEVVRIPRSGHFLRMGQSQELFEKMQSQVGETLILTSGIRGIPKQFDLFFDRVRRTEGNLTQAAHSLAPPGYSFHAIEDFDVGKYGLGLANFSAAFAETELFEKLQRMPEVRIRYEQNNRFGVRFEPWHIRVS